MFCFDEMPCLIVGLHEGMFYKANDMPALLAEGGSRPACRLTFLLVTEGRPQESEQRTQLLLPTFPLLRDGAACAVKLLLLAAKLTSRFQRFVQTGCRRFKVEASALYGAAARPKRPPSQAWAKGAIPNAG